MSERIYVVTVGGVERLISAKSKAEALSYAVKTTMQFALATQKDLVDLITDGIMVESVTDVEEESE
jgi:hypothetical protein